MTTTKTTPAQTKALQNLALLGGETAASETFNYAARKRGFEFGAPPATWGGKPYTAHMRTVESLIAKGLVAITKKEDAGWPEGFCYRISLTEQGRTALR